MRSKNRPTPTNNRRKKTKIPEKIGDTQMEKFFPSMMYNREILLSVIVYLNVNLLSF